MIKRLLVVCSLLACASCAMDPSAGGSALAGNTDRPISRPSRCDRIKVICIDTSVPALLPSAALPMLTLPALPNVLTLPR